AQAFTLADTFAVVPWEIYTWRMAPESVSISSSRHKIQNVVDRIVAAQLVDAYLTESGNADLRPDKDFKFLRHDFRLYLGDLPYRTAEWIEEFAEAVKPYLNQIGEEAYAKLRRDERICLYLLRSGRREEAALAGRLLDRPRISPRHIVGDGETMYWGETVPADEDGRHELDLHEWHLDEQVFSTGRIRHEIESVEADGPALRLRLRTYDPCGLITPDVTATLKLAATGTPLSIRLDLHPDVDGQYVSDALLDIRKIPVGLAGIASRRHPIVSMKRGTKQRNDVLLAPHDMPTHRTTVTYRVLGTHHVIVEPENRAAGRLQITWERVGPLRAMEPLGPYVRATKKRVARVKKIVVGNEGKATVYDSLAKLPGKRELAVFEAQEGRGYTDNPRYIYEELRKRDLPIDVVWAYNGDKSSFPDDVTLVKRGSWEYGRALARAKYWVDSHNLPYLYGKPEGTRYLQTWHGQTLKMMGFDAPGLRMGPEEEKTRFRAAVARWDALVCPSAEFERTFVPAFGVTADLIRAGYPRNDVLVRWAEPEQMARAAEARAALEVPEGRKVLLYAPTFRDSGRRSGQSIRIDLPALVEELGREWVIVVRAHPYDRFVVPAELGHVVRDGGSFADINDLMLASDAVLTDYSSLMFDYANTGRPILLYTDDYEQYKNGERGTYYDLAEIAPGPMLDTTEQLTAALRDLDGTAAAHSERYARFQELFCSYETGHASKMVVDAFFEGGSND
ncbi:MAG TPA: CDP-glycerol glycerophosphotransferase family protein, partial [Streptomyces sp.]